MQKYDLAKLSEQLKDKKWRIRGKWFHSAICNEIFAVGESTVTSKKLGYPFQKSLTVWLQNGDYLDLEDEWHQLRKVIEAEYKKDSRYLHSYADHCLAMGEEVTAFSKELQQREVKSSSNEELVAAYHSLIRKCQDFIPFMMSLHLVDELLTERFDDLLNQFISDRGLTKQNFFEYQTALTLPFRKIFILAEKDDLMQLAVRIKKEQLSWDSKEVGDALEKHTANYRWSNAYLLEYPPFTLNHFRLKLEEMLASDVEPEYNSIQESEAHLRQQQAEYMDQVKGFGDLYDLAKTVQIFGFLRSYRVDVLFVAFVNCWNIVTELAHRLKLDVQDFIFLDSNEVAEALADRLKKYKSIIADRKEGFTSVVVKNDRYELSHADSEALLPYIKLPEVQVTDRVEGATAYPGKIIGRCRVLHELDDMKKVEKGDIIIISMTDPNYIPAMDRAAAFVTDQGGILCHAAIVSREMKKPCVIGTKVGTKTFADNDLIEVDADNGVVTLLERNK